MLKIFEPIEKVSLLQRSKIVRYFIILGLIESGDLRFRQYIEKHSGVRLMVEFERVDAVLRRCIKLVGEGRVNSDFRQTKSYKSYFYKDKDSYKYKAGLIMFSFIAKVLRRVVSEDLYRGTHLSFAEVVKYFIIVGMRKSSVSENEEFSEIIKRLEFEVFYLKGYIGDFLCSSQFFEFLNSELSVGEGEVGEKRLNRLYRSRRKGLDRCWVVVSIHPFLLKMLGSIADLVDLSGFPDGTVVKYFMLSGMIEDENFRKYIIEKIPAIMCELEFINGVLLQGVCHDELFLNIRDRKCFVRKGKIYEKRTGGIKEWPYVAFAIQSLVLKLLDTMGMEVISRAEIIRYFVKVGMLGNEALRKYIIEKCPEALDEFDLKSGGVGLSHRMKSLLLGGLKKLEEGEGVNSVDQKL